MEVRRHAHIQCFGMTQGLDERNHDENVHVVFCLISYLINCVYDVHSGITYNPKYYTLYVLILCNFFIMRMSKKYFNNH